ncbi:MAG: peptide chain release factor N(5)-glutamine methyltransferase [Gemmatimonadaceae bacterium]|nr:peptide chain release factor N(5)-glutamine methyltransferase [Gemmatimonadaceae bacterium]
MTSSALRTIGALVDAMARTLGVHGAAAPREARELLAALHDMPNHWPSVRRDVEVSNELWTAGLHAARRRATGTPVQYVAGRAAFRHLVLDVDERVLIPRPETEMLVEIVLDRCGTDAGGIAVDVGTGSGAIALALASEGPFERVLATDVSLDAVHVARANAASSAEYLRADVEVRHGSLLSPITERGVRAVVSNPPYIAFGEREALPTSVRDWEPAVALYCGDEGLSVTARLVRDAAVVLAPNGVLAIETDTRRTALVAELIAANGAYGNVQLLLDLTGRERFVVARRLEEQG